jgi:hypothetical protein
MMVYSKYADTATSAGFKGSYLSFETQFIKVQMDDKVTKKINFKLSLKLTYDK